MAEDDTPLTDKYFGTSPPPISKRLCQKAVDDNESLTQAEGWLFLAQGIFAGRFLAEPQALDDEGFNRVLFRPPPEALKWNIQATMGRDSISEVFRDYWNPDRTEQLSFDAHECVTLGWWTHHTLDIWYICPCPKHAEAEDAVQNAAAELAYKTEEELKIGICAQQRATKPNPIWWDIAHEWRDGRAKEDKDLRKTLRARINAELASATPAELEAVTEVRQRVAAEIAEEKAENAEENAAKEQEAKREAEERAKEKEERMKTKKWRKAARRREYKKYMKKLKAEGVEGRVDQENDVEDGDTDSVGSEDVIVQDIYAEMERHPPTREGIVREDLNGAEEERMRQAFEASLWG